MAHSVSDHVVELLLGCGVKCVFGQPGDGVNGLVEVFRGHSEQIRYVHGRHEEAIAPAACATWRDIAVRFVAANLHPDHDTIAVFRRSNKAAFEVAFLQVLLLARESGLLRLGTVSIDGTKIDANASKIRSVRYDRAKELRARLAADIAALTARAEAADAENRDPRALPAELARHDVLKAKRDAACARLEAEAEAEAEAARRRMRRREPPMQPGRAVAAGLRSRPTTNRRQNGKAT